MDPDLLRQRLLRDLQGARRRRLLGLALVGLLACLALGLGWLAHAAAARQPALHPAPAGAERP